MNAKRFMLRFLVALLTFVIGVATAVMLHAAAWLPNRATASPCWQHHHPPVYFKSDELNPPLPPSPPTAPDYRYLLLTKDAKDSGDGATPKRFYRFHAR